MPNVATWMQAKDEKWFARDFAPHPQLQFWNALNGDVALDEADALLLTGGPDIAPEFLHQAVPDPSILTLDTNPRRDAWEFEAVKHALNRGLPIFAICKGCQLLNVALGGTLHLDIRGHNAPEMKDHDVQPLRTDRSATHRLEKVNSSHHQAIDRLGDGCVAEAWCADDGVIEQMRVADYPFALAVQYHPERGDGVYAPLFAEFVTSLAQNS